MNTRSGTILVGMLAIALVGLVGCPMAPPGDGNPPAGYTAANAVRGGLLYDKWWGVLGVDAPTGDHSLWATRPDTTSNTRTGADTWRCKECHGWDYKGVGGAYGSGSHRTGIGGIFGTTATPQEVFDNVKTTHGFGAAGLADADIWDLAKFVLEGQVNTDDYIDGAGAFMGNATNGAPVYTNGLAGAIACSICHGTDGKTIDFGGGEFVGTVAVDNPWEFLHKVRFGHPGSAMPSAVADGATMTDILDLRAHSQTLPTQ